MIVAVSLLTALNVMPCHCAGVGTVAAPSPNTSCPNASSAVEVKMMRLSGLPLAAKAPSMAMPVPIWSMNSRPNFRTTPGSIVHLAPKPIVTLPASA